MSKELSPLEALRELMIYTSWKNPKLTCDNDFFDNYKIAEKALEEKKKQDKVLEIIKKYIHIECCDNYYFIELNDKNNLIPITEYDLLKEVFL